MRSAGSCLLHSGNQLLRVASRPQTQTTRIAKENRWMQIFFKENALMAFNSKPNDDVLLAWHATLSPILFFLHVSLGLNVCREQLLMFRLSYRWNTGPQRRKGSTGPAHKFNPRWRPKRPKWSSDMPRHALTCPTCSLYNSLGSLVDYSRSFEAIPSAPHVLHTCLNSFKSSSQEIDLFETFLLTGHQADAFLQCLAMQSSTQRRTKQWHSGPHIEQSHKTGRKTRVHLF